ncbi:MAG: serine protease [Nanoarchaeota archaeon]|nr:serine protease [Nanoarchaeota archaeon]
MKVKKNICSLLTALSLSSSFSPSSAVAYDKNDNYVDDKVSERIKKPAAFVFVEERFPCADYAFYEEPSACDAETKVNTVYSFGSGVVLADKKNTKYVLTADHVLPKYNSNFIVNIHAPKSKTFVKAKVYKRDAKRDLALLLIDKNNTENVPSASDICFGTGYSIGDHVVSVGYTNYNLSFIEGLVHSLNSLSLITISGHFISGNSGGITYAFSEGKPVGIGVMAVSGDGTFDGLNGIISSERVHQFLNGTPVEDYNGARCKEVEKSEKESTGK